MGWILAHFLGMLYLYLISLHLRSQDHPKSRKYVVEGFPIKKVKVKGLSLLKALSYYGQ